MALADRILQLKLMTDVSELSRDMKKVTTSTTKMGRGMSKLSGVTGKVGAKFDALGSTIATAVGGMAIQAATDFLQQGIADAIETQDTWRDLERTLHGVSQNIPADLDKIAQAAENALNVNVDDTEFVKGVEGLVSRMRISVPRAIRVTDVAMDVMAHKHLPNLQSAIKLVEGALRGKKRAFEALGIPMRLMGDRLGILRFLENKFKDAAVDAASTTQGRWEQLNTRMGEIGEGIGQMFLDLGTDVIGASDTLNTEIAKWQPILQTALDSIGPTIDTAATVIGIAADNAGSLIFNGVMGPTTKLPGAVGEQVKLTQAQLDSINVAIAKAKVEGGLSGISGALDNTLSDAQRFAIRWNQALRTINVPVLGQIAQNLILHRGLPHMAAGGIVNRPTLAVVGEHGPEAVVPLRGGSGGMGSITVNVTAGVGNPVEIGREVDRVLRAYRGRAGLAA